MVPEVSVIIPVFQNQIGVERCLAAIARQDGIAMSDIEVIVIDNGSEPKLTVSKSLPFPVKLLICSRKGAYSARNAGVKMANGKVLVFLDADCWPEKLWIRAGLDALCRNGKDSIVGGDVRFETAPHPSVVESYQVLMGFGQERSISELQFSATANLFVSRQVFEQVGAFNEDLLSGGDREWSWRAGKLGVPIYFSKDAMVWTKPRTTLRGALIQARRVAGGRMSLEDNAEIVAVVGLEKIQPNKGLLDKIKVILCARKLPLTRRLLIFGVAVIVRLVHDFERIRIGMGGEFERR
ncbi:glycosyltransferase family 2 protein [Marinobacter sp. F3R11]|uniref:glycosyltransferase family 2 protein n=1 Tax=Marinobacter sp. F3R11 TaxID=2267231 RepID=UPI000DE8173A|nr:glycosyltransferase [Marinobacter sp. F3R11]RBW48279.1 hypothetical protein DS878_08730 [Marinobacter sp. F3R11]